MPLKKGGNKKDITRVEKNPYDTRPKEGFDAKKYNGIMSFHEDALTIQKKLRNEWERDLS